MKNKRFNQTSKFFLAMLMFLASTAFATAQVATGGTYKLDQSVIAGGGGTSASGNQFSITGAIGQAVAGSGASNSPYALQSGFFTAAAPFAPTAATVSIGGRVSTNDGRGIRNVILTMTGMDGSQRTATTTAFGYYRFTDVAAGKTYIITARGKRFTFASPTQVVNANDDAAEIDFIGIPAQNLRNIE